MNFHTAPSYSIKGSGKKSLIQLSGEKNETNGPATYNLSELGKKTNIIAFDFGKSKRYQINHRVQKTPAPITYNNQKPTNSIQITFPKDTREEKPNLNPEGGVYNPQVKFIKSKINTYTMGSRYPGFTEGQKKLPGPTDYNNLPVDDSSRKSRFGGAGRFSEKKISHPGPGQYNLTSNSAFLRPQGKFSRSSRFVSQFYNYPSPHEYAKQSFVDENTKKRAGKSLSGRLNGAFDTNDDCKDSFLKYNIAKPLAGTFGKFSKDSRSKSQKILTVGPGNYNVAQFKVYNTPRAFLKTAQYEQKPTYLQNPGAGTYQTYIPNTTKFSVPRSHSADVINQNPGVGRYRTTQGIQTKKGFAVGKGNRTNFVSRSKPGVGDYNLIQIKTGGISIPKAQRTKDIEITPGAGHYHIQSTIGNVRYYSKYVS